MTEPSKPPAVRKLDDGSTYVHVKYEHVEQPPAIRAALDRLGETVRRIRERRLG